jgi:hypothetical protein
MIRRAGVGLALVVIVVGGGCGRTTETVDAPFVATRSTEGGPGSGLWGDGSSGPTGMHLGCIEGRRFAVLVTARNRTKRTITVLEGGGPQRFTDVIERVAVQVRLAPPPPQGDLVQPGLRPWIGWNSPPVAIPAGRDVWVQSNFLMRNCGSLRQKEALTVNRSITLTYRAGGSKGAQAVSVAGARLVLHRGPPHPSLPINQAG